MKVFYENTIEYIKYVNDLAIISKRTFHDVFPRD